MASEQPLIRAMYPVKGFRLGTVEAGMRYPNRKDLVVMTWPEGASVAGVFTRNRFCAAPVELSRQRLVSKPCALVVNTGNANAGTGGQGLADAETCTARLAEVLGCLPEQVLPFSTGVIGEYLPVPTLLAGLPACVERSAESEAAWHQAAEGIMTTDTRPKGESVRFEHEGVVYTLTGIAKGAGMIRPDMATMLAFVSTDVSIETACLQQILNEVVNCSFNRITVDGDTSTNDACLLVATGAAGNETVVSTDQPLYRVLSKQVAVLCQRLAQSLVRDAEGATKFVSVVVEQAGSRQEALEVAYTVAHSPLVKTALFASDPNWGRILAAVGRANVDDLDVAGISIFLGDVCIITGGGVAADYREADGQAVMDQAEVVIRIALSRGELTETVWTSDLSHDYVSINAEYRT
ncbi:bifunctional glutamate N-acetyltransferase/amino-acid acetyltransferase ArgJ [Kistimonas asteriae]|uniref:bifunctional glutamate N-acetyltransferase/amino-acid acetyltransferase ArgJ n=1 Tax=Kistimonas asteriae TaxID=517724 RepID=UPI001BA6CBC1|nr:bifunctional glutamate N-acetyltransferase/amino-acid acetyltransferase ArgJ [Kistimonas asteriae]